MSNNIAQNSYGLIKIAPYQPRRQSFVGSLIEFVSSKRINVVVAFLFMVYAVIVLKIVTWRYLDDSLFFGLYSIMVSVYILSRFILSYFYVPKALHAADMGYRPSITFVTPSKNEEEGIARTIICMAESDYPKDKIEIIAIDDGSSDGTYAEMQRGATVARSLGVRADVVRFPQNKGKRHGMAYGVKKARGDIVIFIDSDSYVENGTVKELVKYFTEEKVAAVAGHAYVANKDVNMLTKMQAVRYFVAFKAYKSAEALFGTVTCCSGCCSAYRRSVTLPVIDEWLGQRFLGTNCTYGDDRSLTNFLLARGYDAMFADEARSTTIVPEDWGKFMRQQLRWKKSWTRESFIALKFMWKRNPIMFFSFVMGLILPLVAPVVFFRAVVWYPIMREMVPVAYIAGLVVMSVLYGLFYRIYHKDNLWIYGMFFSWFYSIILVWQLPYAILTLRDQRWGTR